MDILALELIDEIIGHVDEKDGLRRFDLRTCSLVCRFWVPSSQRRLFHRIKFKYPLWQYRELHAEIRQLDQLLLNSPHIANYIRVLKLPDMTYVSRFTDVRGLDEPLSPLLPKLTQVQKIEIHGLAWNDLRLERDLRQSLCKVLELPSVSFVCIYGAQFNGMDDFMNFISHARSLTCLLLYPDAMWMSQNPVALDDTQADDNKHTERCCISRLDMRFRCNNPGSVSWLLGPRSHLDVSHIHTLHIYLPDEAKDDSFNRLLCTIGSSLKHLCISLPCLSSVPIDLAFNVNIEILSLVSMDMQSGRLYALGKVLSTISASNHIHHMELRMDRFCGSTLRVDLAALDEVYSVLAGPLLQFLRVLHINIMSVDGSVISNTRG